MNEFKNILATMINKFLFLFLSTFLFTTASVSSSIEEDLSTLCSPIMQGRLAGSIGATRTNQFLSYRYYQIGLTSFFQEKRNRSKSRLPDYSQTFSTILDSTLSTNSVEITNIIGLIRGQDSLLQSEYIVIGAHYDHLGFGGKLSYSKQKDSLIHPGADDNASGVAALLSVAEQLQKQKSQLKRSILIASFGAEEWGAKGSTDFVKRVFSDTIKIVAMLNLDMVGRLDSLRRLVIYGTATSPIWIPKLQSANEKFQFHFNYVNDSFGAGDHLPFYKHSVPFLFFFTGAHTDYHRPSDTADKLNVEGISKIADFTTQLALLLSQTTEQIEFTAVSETAIRKRNNQFNVYVGVIPDFKNTAQGFTLLGASENSPAEKAGIQSGDVMVAMNDQPIQTIQDYMTILDLHRPGDEVEITLLRNQEKIKVKLIVGMK